MTPEGKVKKECRAYLREQWPDVYIFSPVQMGYGAATVDDLICCDGRFFAVEYKRADQPAEPTERQLQCLKAVRKAGGIAVVARSWRDIEDMLGQRGLVACS